uniref:hypothetical protein n=1 Tax=unclassified Paenibacillus TaxID=185978 RepID=UPI002117B6A7
GGHNLILKKSCLDNGEHYKSPVFFRAAAEKMQGKVGISSNMFLKHISDKTQAWQGFEGQIGIRDAG